MQQLNLGIRTRSKQPAEVKLSIRMEKKDVCVRFSETANLLGFSNNCLQGLQRMKIRKYPLMTMKAVTQCYHCSDVGALTERLTQRQI